MQGSFAGGGSDRFKSSPPLPSYGGSSENRICRTCKGSERGNDRVGFKRCRCEDPKFPERKLSTNAIGLKIQDSHGLWLAQVYRVLRPGGSIKVFAATRTQHRLTAAIEAVGFVDIGVEAWVYGSGFPKSMDVSKAIDKQGGADTQASRQVQDYLKERREAKGLSKGYVDIAVFNGTTRYSWIEGRGGERANEVYLPTPEEWILLKVLLDLDDRFDTYIKTNSLSREHRALADGGRAMLVGMEQGDWGYQQDGKRWGGVRRITAPASEAARQWDGWGTALKPAWEPVIVARKPLV